MNDVSWVDDVSCDLGLRQYLDAELEKEQADYKKSKNPSWYPSDLGKDLFTRFIKRKGAIPLPIDSRTLRKFEIGKLWEARLHQIINHQLDRQIEECGGDKKLAAQKYGMARLDLHPDQPPPFDKRMENNEIGLRGYYDRMLLRRINENEWNVIIFEVKSVSSQIFHNQRREGQQPKGNRMQMMFYLERIRTPEYWTKVVETCEREYGIVPTGAKAVLSQVSKDDGSMWERTYDFDPKLYAEILAEIEALNEHWVLAEDHVESLRQETSIYGKEISDEEEWMAFMSHAPAKPKIIVIENGKAKINWHVGYSDLKHYILGIDHEKVLDDAEKLVNRHAYMKKALPIKLGQVEKDIEAFNELCSKIEIPYYPPHQEEQTPSLQSQPQSS